MLRTFETAKTLEAWSAALMNVLDRLFAVDDTHQSELQMLKHVFRRLADMQSLSEFGDTIKFETVLEENLGATDLSVNATVEAQVAGAAGNVNANTIVVIDSSLTDSSITVDNAAQTTGGADELTDAEYREYARLQIETIRGGTCTALEAAALNVSGVESAKAVEFRLTVREWDTAGSTPIGEPFDIPIAKLYIADANGTADATLISAVDTAINSVRACGVEVQVLSGVGLTLQWDFSFVLNPGGPNFAQLSTDPTEIRKTAQAYVNDLALGSDFIRLDGENAIMAVWGPAGTNDLVSVSTNIPTGDVDADVTEKFLAGLTDITVT